MKNIYLSILMTCFGTSVIYAQNNTPVSFDGQQDSIISLPYTKIDKERHVGAVSTVTGEQLSHSNKFGLNSAIDGLATGLIIMNGSCNPGAEGFTWKVRGLSRGNDGDGPLSVIDGMNNRSLSSITNEEIESVQVLKDITAKMLYGSKAANGVIMITTKRGKGKTSYKATGEYGFKQATRTPEYLSSYDYVKYFRQAMINDGLTPRYTEEDMIGYAEGVDPLRYPNVDFYDTFVKPNTSFYRANVQVNGNKNNVGYFLNLGYYGEGGLEAVGKSTSYDRLNLRSNLDYKINDFMSAYLDIAARWDMWSRPNITYNNFFNAISTHRPNDYPLFMGEYGDDTMLGWSKNQDTNLYGELTRKGYADDENSYAQTNIGLNFDLYKITPGLKAKLFMSYDAFSALSKGKTYKYSRLRLEDDGTFTKVGEDEVKGSEAKFSDNIYRNFGVTGQIDYSRGWDKHEVLSNLVYNVQRKMDKMLLNGPKTVQDDKSMNIALRANYAYDRRYAVEVDGSLMGSDKFTKENRWGLFGAAGFAWNISNEEFMKDIEWIDFLKLKGSFGVMGYDNSFAYMVYDNFYTANGNYRVGENNSEIEYGFKPSQIGNKNFTFEKSRETNIGIEGTFFSNRLSMEGNFFYEYRYDIPTNVQTLIPGYVGYGSVYPMLNYNEISNRGVEVGMSWKDRIGELKYQIGGNFMFTRAIHEVYDENNLYEHQNRTGKSTDAIMGWVSDGLYKNQQEIDDHSVSSLYGEIKPGDIRFLNVTNDLNDNVINDYDKVFIGNSFPRVNYALNINLEYKGFSLYMLGQGVAGFDRMMTNSYYFCTGENKYSVNVLGTAIVNPETGNIQDNATYPRLTSLSTGHSYRNSDYWMENGSYFKLRTVELAYQLPKKVCKKFGANGLKFFAKGDNLFTLSSIKDVDPEDINAGITGNPMFRSFSFGFDITY